MVSYHPAPTTQTREWESQGGGQFSESVGGGLDRLPGVFRRVAIGLVFQALLELSKLSEVKEAVGLQKPRVQGYCGGADRPQIWGRITRKAASGSEKLGSS